MDDQACTYFCNLYGDAYPCLESVIYNYQYDLSMIVSNSSACEYIGSSDYPCSCDLTDIPVTYYSDSDGDGIGCCDEPETVCPIDKPDGFVEGPCGESGPSCTCYSNVLDDCGVCNGNNACFGCTDTGDKDLNWFNTEVVSEFELSTEIKEKDVNISKEK